MRRLLAIVGAAALVAVLPLPARGGGPQALDLAGAVGFTQHTAWIEQQDDWPMPADPIVNPDSSCQWSINDHQDWQASGYLDAGASTSRSRCIVSDFDPVTATHYGITATWSVAPYGFAGLSVVAPSPDLVVSVCYQPQGRCFRPIASASGKDWTYRFCGRANYGPSDPALIDIAGSSGGRGVVTTITFSVTNPTSRRIRDVWASGGFSSDIVFPSACNPLPTQTDYPFTYG